MKLVPTRRNGKGGLRPPFLLWGLAFLFLLFGAPSCTLPVAGSAEPPRQGRVSLDDILLRVIVEPADDSALVRATGLQVGPTEVLTACHALRGARNVYVAARGESPWRAYPRRAAAALDLCVIETSRRATFIVPAPSAATALPTDIAVVGFDHAGERLLVARGRATAAMIGGAHLLLTSAAVQPGSSGGIVLDAQGRWLGTALASGPLPDANLLVDVTRLLDVSFAATPGWPIAGAALPSFLDIERLWPELLHVRRDTLKTGHEYRDEGADWAVSIRPDGLCTIESTTPEPATALAFAFRPGTSEVRLDVRVSLPAAAIGDIEIDLPGHDAQAVRLRPVLARRDGPLAAGDDGWHVTWATSEPAAVLALLAARGPMAIRTPAAAGLPPAPPAVGVWPRVRDTCF